MSNLVHCANQLCLAEINTDQDMHVKVAGEVYCDLSCYKEDQKQADLFEWAAKGGPVLDDVKRPHRKHPWWERGF